jgi:hypothetical protein
MQIERLCCTIGAPSSLCKSGQTGGKCLLTTWMGGETISAPKKLIPSTNIAPILHPHNDASFPQPFAYQAPSPFLSFPASVLRLGLFLPLLVLPRHSLPFPVFSRRLLALEARSTECADHARDGHACYMYRTSTGVPSENGATLAGVLSSDSINGRWP